MMKTSLLRTAALVWALSIASLLQSYAQIRLGYCDEEPKTSSLAHASTSATISCAIALTPQMQAPYSFSKLSHLRIALTAPEQLSSLRIWVRRSLNDETDLASADIDPASLASGWNTLPFDLPIDVEAQHTLYCGYSYTQTERTYFALSGTKGKAGSFWIAADNTWLDYSKKYEPVCIQAELTSPYSHAIRLNDAMLERSSVSDDATPLRLRFNLLNIGMEPLASLSLAYNIDETESQLCPIDLSAEPISFGQERELQIEIPLTGIEGQIHTLDFEVKQPNGKSNEAGYDCHGKLYFELGRHLSDDVNAPILLEEFTSERNGYAPAGQHHLREALSRAERPVILISRHEGYGPADSWWVKDSDYDASFFGPERLSFVPAAWIHRQSLPFSSTLDIDSIAQRISEVAPTRYAEIAISNARYDAASKRISAHIDVEMLSIASFKNPCLIVCLAEDEEPSEEQKNYYPERYDSSVQRDAILQFASLPNQGSLFGGANLEAVAHGQIPLADLDNQSFDINFPPLIVTPPAQTQLRIVAYIADRGATHTILAVNELILSR